LLFGDFTLFQVANLALQFLYFAANLVVVNLPGQADALLIGGFQVGFLLGQQAAEAG